VICKISDSLKRRQQAKRRQQSFRSIGPFHADVSVRACTSCRPFVITSKEKVWSLSCWILLLSTVSYRKYLF